MSRSLTTAPPPPPGRSQIGVIRRILRDPTPVLDEIAAAGLPVVGFGRGVLRMAIVAEPQLVHEVFSMPVTRFRWSHPLNVLRFVVGDQSMLVSDGDDHRRRRGRCSPPSPDGGWTAGCRRSSTRPMPRSPGCSLRLVAMTG